MVTLLVHPITLLLQHRHHLLLDHHLYRLEGEVGIAVEEVTTESTPVGIKKTIRLLPHLDIARAHHHPTIEGKIHVTIATPTGHHHP